MVKIRLKRMGAKKKPFYRIVVADSRRSRDGKFIEEIGFYDPLKQPVQINVDSEKAQKWLSEGAKPTAVVRSLFEKAGVGKYAEKSETTEDEDKLPATDETEAEESGEK